jgi:allophanate hydrolase subunit 2
VTPSGSSRELRLRVLPGPEAGAFEPSELARFFASAWRVSAECDRRGLRLERLEGATPLAHRAAPEIPPSGTVPGTIQVPGGGLPIVLGPDGPVTGGYPRIATVIGPDLALLGRAGPGAVLRFARVTLEEALRALD